MLWLLPDNFKVVRKMCSNVFIIERKKYYVYSKKYSWILHKSIYRFIKLSSNSSLRNNFDFQNVICLCLFTKLNFSFDSWHINHNQGKDSSIRHSWFYGSSVLRFWLGKWNGYLHAQVAQKWQGILPISTKGSTKTKPKKDVSYWRG